VLLPEFTPDECANYFRNSGYAQLRQQPGVAPRALEFAILTAARTSETLGATWAEIDMAGKIWTVPAGRVKSGREHRVALSDAALAVLRSMAALHRLAAGCGIFPRIGDRVVFPRSEGVSS
jgi:integrase